MQKFDFICLREMGGGKDHYSKGATRSLPAAEALALVIGGALSPAEEEGRDAIAALIAASPEAQAVVQPVPSAGEAEASPEEEKSDDSNGAQAKVEAPAPENKADVTTPAAAAAAPAQSSPAASAKVTPAAAKKAAGNSAAAKGGRRR